ncbi:MAG: dihydroneopterin aldolase [Proteobacteria bacterium]|nr:dihydroneopterin aldolase [Pseudomonadota bacterium]
MIITLKGIKTSAIIGFWESERHAKQRLIIHISFEVDEKMAVAKDNVDHSVDYAKLEAEILEKVPNTTFNLLEKMNQFVTDIVMSRPAVQWAEVEVVKPDAPLQATDSVSVKQRTVRK